MINKIVGFAGHRYPWHNVGIEEKLKNTIETLINDGYNIFYVCNNGYFDEISTQIVKELKKKYSFIKIIKILTYYHHQKSKNFDKGFDETIYPELENYHPKQKIIKRNEWIVEHCDIIVSHIQNTFKSGAYRTIKYAEKLNKKIIFI